MNAPLNTRAKLSGLLRCPRCHTAFEGQACANAQCEYAAGFQHVRGQPVLIDFEDSIFSPDEYEDGKGYADAARPRNLAGRVELFLMGGSRGSSPPLEQFLTELRTSARRRVLVIGGGSEGSGMGSLYDAPDLTVVGSDVFASPATDLIADGHSLPFRDGVFDGVVIQAVLEHVLDPWRVVAEIRRVLAPDGLVYAETPFMQQVHMGAYDFTRFTRSGHRWLFRGFDELDAGVGQGAGVTAIWAIRYLLRAIRAPRKLANLITMAAFPLRFLGSKSADGACGVYFVGRRSERELHPREMVPYYRP